MGDAEFRNSLFDEFVEEYSDDSALQLRGMIAYALYKRAKREFVESCRAESGCDPDGDRLRDYVRSYTDTSKQVLIDGADMVLRDFAAAVVESSRADIIAGALKGSFWRSVYIGLVTNLIFAFLLIGLAFFSRIFGFDLLDAYNSIPGATK